MILKRIGRLNMDKDKVLQLLKYAYIVTETHDKNEIIMEIINDIDPNEYDKLNKMFEDALNETMERKK
jgi:hypothetical protein